MDDMAFVPLLSDLRTFLDDNPRLRLLTTDLYDPDVIAGLNFGSAGRDRVLAAARDHQSLARVTADPELVDRLYRAGLRSAAAIASKPLYMLREQLRTADAHGVAPQSIADAALAEAHAKAVDLHSRTVHLCGELMATLSPHGRALSSNHLARMVGEEFGHLPSFADLFGSQDYIASPHCQSVVGPAAYFVDLMRVVDEQITSNPKNHIPDWQKLEARRQKLFEQPLTCAETTTPIPKIAIINQVIHDHLVPRV